MSTMFAMAVLVVWLVGCQTVTPTATMMSSPQVTPTIADPTTVLPEPTLRPTPTSLAQGWFTRSATSNPSPACPDHYPWFFDNQAQECASYVLNTGGTMQRFEHGLMVWLAEGGHTYILLDDGSPFKLFREVVDSGEPYLPDANSNLVPPPGFYPTVLGFAKFWRGLVPGTDWIRKRLGWATAPEVSYSVLWQCNNATDETARCYFTGAQNEIIVMTRGGGQYWNYWQGPVR